MQYYLHILILIGIYSLIVYSLNLTNGFSGLLNLSPAAFFGIGAYSFALLISPSSPIHLFPENSSISFIFALFLSFCITSIIAFLSGIPALRFRSDSFVLVTLAFQIIVFTILYNWTGLTKGPFGISEIPRPDLFGWEVNTNIEYVFLLLLMNLIVLTILFLLYSSPFGISLKACRDNEIGAQSTGIPSRIQFLYAFILCGGFMAIPGSLYASYVTYIDPTTFNINEGIFIVVILSLGGSGNRVGPIIGVFLMLLLPELLRFLNLPNTIAPNMRQVIYGFILLILMFLRPQGIKGEFSP